VSTDFVSRKPILLKHLKSFDFKGVSVDSMPDENSVILTDGINYLWAIETPGVSVGSLDENGDFRVESNLTRGILFTRYAGNYPDKIIQAIEEHFETELISEGADDFSKYVTEC
jgi:hypothetical protein